MYVITVPERH